MICRPVRCAMASGCTTPNGWDPAENAGNRSAPNRLNIAFARIERAEFPVHRRSTLQGVGIGTPISAPNPGL